MHGGTANIVYCSQGNSLGQRYSAKNWVGWVSVYHEQWDTGCLGTFYKKKSSINEIILTSSGFIYES